MAPRTYFQVDVLTNCGTRLNDIATTASRGNLVVFWVNI